MTCSTAEEAAAALGILADVQKEHACEPDEWDKETLYMRRDDLIREHRRAV